MLVYARFVLVLSLVMASLALAAPRKKKVVPKSAANVATEVELKKTLDAAEAKVGACVLENGPPGAFTLVVKAQLVLNSAGQLMSSTVTLPESAGAAKMRGCIEGVLKGLTWPKSSGPIVNAEREWTFKAE